MKIRIIKFGNSHDRMIKISQLRITKVIFICFLMLFSIIQLSPRNVSANPNIIDVDNDDSGSCIVRDDDNSKESLYALLHDHSVYKRLWLYQNDVKDADLIALWIYAYVVGTVDNRITHEIYINGHLEQSFNACECFPRKTDYEILVWTHFYISPKNLIIGQCNEIRIFATTDDEETVVLEIGIDNTFKYLDETYLHDFDRSFTDSISASIFPGEFMIYLEFIKEDSILSKGIDAAYSSGDVSLRYWWPYRDTCEWDSAGIILDWTDMTQAEYNCIYQVRLWLYCQPSGNIVGDTYNDGIDIEINQDYEGSFSQTKIVKQFNPYVYLPYVAGSNTWNWYVVTIFDKFQSNKWQLQYDQINYVDIHANDPINNDDDNNLRIAKYSLTPPSPKLTWWYLKDGTGTEGGYRDPTCDDCKNEELLLFVQVLKSKPLNNFRTGNNEKLFRMGGSCLENTRYNLFPDYDDTVIQQTLNWFNLQSAWGNNYALLDSNIRQWSFYGEMRSPSDINGADCTDIYFHYGPGSLNQVPAMISLYDTFDLSEIFATVSTHDNDDYYQFCSADTVLSEAEGNGDITDEGSDGFDYDLEWLFIYSPDVFSDEYNSPWISLLWHGTYGVFGFNHQCTPEMLTLNLNLLRSALTDNKVCHAFEIACSNVFIIGESHITTGGFAFFNADYWDAYLWGTNHASVIDKPVVDRNRIECIHFDNWGWEE